MAQPSETPPGKTFLAAAAGGLGGAVVGAVAAKTVMGGASTGDNNAGLQPAEPQQQEVMVAEQRQER